VYSGHMIEMTDDLRAKFAELLAPFDRSQIHGLPRGGTQIDYVGHAEVTRRLLEVDPAWNWEPVSTDEHGLPRFERSQDGKPVGLWIRLTVLGVTRLGYGSVEPKNFEPEKILIGDALRNAAMRFGVALDLWSKSDRQSGGDDNGGGYNGARRNGSRPSDREPGEPPPPANGGGSRAGGPPPTYVWKGAQSATRVKTLLLAGGMGAEAAVAAVEQFTGDMTEADCRKAAETLAAGGSAPVAPPAAAAPAAAQACDECGHVGPLVPMGDGSDRQVCADDAGCWERVTARVGAPA
jgi:hypothetical protein